MKYYFTIICIFFSVALLAQQTELKTHTVEAGNTYFSIAKQYGVTIDEIKKWNNITAFTLKPGEVLIVSDPEKVSAVNNTPIKTIQEPSTTKDTTVAKSIQQETKSKNETIEDLGFRVSEIDTANLKNEGLKFMPAQTDTSRNNLIFCGGVEDDKPVGISSVFFNNRGQNYVYVFVEKDTAFGNKFLIADLFLKNEDGTTTTKISTTNYEVKPKWKYTIFKHFINQPGLYEIVVYDNNRKKIGDGQVRILQ
jgi:LysM repeat protein